MKRSLFSAITIGLFCLSAPAAELTTLAGKKIAGEFVKAEVAGIVIRTPAGPVNTLPTEAAVVEFDIPQKDISAAKYIDVELLDGSLLHCTSFVIKGSTAEVALLSLDGTPGTALRIPVAAIYTMIRDANEPKNRLDFQTLVKNRGRRDILVYRGDTKLDGSDGTFGEADAEGKSIAFTDAASSQVRKPRQPAIHGMIFAQVPGGERPVTICRVLDVHKNSLNAKSIRVDGNAMEVVTAGDVSIVYPDRKLVSRLDFTSASLKYLSDLIPKIDSQLTDGEATRLGAAFMVSKDKSRNDELSDLRLDGKRYAKGLGVAAGVSLTFEINGDYREFQTMLGVDDYFRENITVKVTIEGDNRVLFTETVKKSDKPRQVNIDVRNVKILRILIESPDGMTTGREVDLAEARVVK